MSKYSPTVLPTARKHWGESLADALGQGVQSYEHFSDRRREREENERELSREIDADYIEKGIRPPGTDAPESSGWDSDFGQSPDGSGRTLGQVLTPQPPQSQPAIRDVPQVGDALANVIDPAAPAPPPEPRSSSGVPGGFDGNARRFERRRLKPVTLPSGRVYDPNVLLDRRHGEELAEALAQQEAESRFRQPSREEQVSERIRELVQSGQSIEDANRTARMEYGYEPPSPRNIDRLSPEGIRAETDLARALAPIRASSRRPSTPRNPHSPALGAVQTQLSEARTDLQRAEPGARRPTFFREPADSVAWEGRRAETERLRAQVDSLTRRRNELGLAVQGIAAPSRSELTAEQIARAKREPEYRAFKESQGYVIP